MNNQKELILLQDLGYLKPTPKSNYTKRYAIYKCICGIIFKAQIQHINRKLTTSCGCVRKNNITLMNVKNSTHGLTNHRLYSVWSKIIDRCNNEKSKHYKNYGARGITVCERWLHIENFVEDMYPTYQEGLSIDRIDNEKGYSYDNCRWTTQTVQSRNKRKIISTNTSGYKGVSWNNEIKKWYCYINVNKKRIFLGYFKDKIKAAETRDKYILDNNLEHTRNF